MSTNAIPLAEKSVLALAEDCADGCASHEVEVGLKQTMEADLRALILALKGDIAATPPTAGLISLHKQREQELAEAEAARGAKDAEVRTFLSTALSQVTAKDAMSWFASCG